MCSLLMFVVNTICCILSISCFLQSSDGRMITIPFSAIFVIRIADLLGFHSNSYLNLLIIICTCLLLSSVATIILCVCFILEKLRSIQFPHHFYVFTATVANSTLSSFIDNMNAECQFELKIFQENFLKGVTHLIGIWMNYKSLSLICPTAPNCFL